jgi:hypothetical protein
MSAQFVAQMTEFAKELAALRACVAELAARVENLEAESMEKDVDIDTLTVRPRGRPRKAQQ